MVGPRLETATKKGYYTTVHSTVAQGAHSFLGKFSLWALRPLHHEVADKEPALHFLRNRQAWQLGFCSQDVGHQPS
jgi:hypothetical protein